MANPVAASVSWAFIVGVDDDGNIELIDFDDAIEVKAKRAASLDDIYSASVIASNVHDYWFTRPSEDVYTLAFLVFQMPDGQIAASPNIFENIVAAKPFPGQAQSKGAFGVLQAQIIAQKTADAIQMMSMVAQARANKADPDAAKKSAGGLYVA